MIRIALSHLNQLTQDAFTGALGDIFEHSPWVPQRTWPQRPFASVELLHGALCTTLAQASKDEQLALIRAHPQLAGKAAIRGELTAASAQEQSGAGLDQCSAEEFAQLTALNNRYDAKFGFPFILAVRGYGRHEIIAQLAERIERPRDVEIAEALRQIERIALLRLGDRVAA